MKITYLKDINLRDIRIFVSTPATGKSYLEKNYDCFVDMDALKAKYKYGLLSDEEIELSKGNHDILKTKGGSVEYISNQIDELLTRTNKILLFAPNPQIVEVINNKKLPYCLVYTSMDTVEEIRSRMRERGNQENFIKAMTDPFPDFYANHTADSRPAVKVILDKGEHLADLILPVINGQN